MRTLVVWIFNGVVALLSLLAICCYFLAPVWQVKVSYKVDGEQLKEMVNVDEADLGDILEDGLELSLAVKVEMPVLLSSVSPDADASVEKFIGNNVNDIVDQVTSTISKVITNVVKGIAKDIVSDAINEQVKARLEKLNSDSSDNAVHQKLIDAGVNEDYYTDQAGKIVDEIFSDDGTDIDTVGGMVADTIADVYVKLAEVDPVFQGATLTEENKQEISNSVSETLGEFAEADGSLNVNDFVIGMALDMLHEMNGTQETDDSLSKKEQLDKEVTAFLTNLIPDAVYDYVVWGFRGLLGLVVLSALTWVYILIKLLVKLIKLERKNPTVKLKLPIWLGWLPFLILAALPSVALMFLPKVLGMMGVEGFGSLSIVFTSSGIIAAVAALICFGISIFFWVVRSGIKKEEKAKKGD